MPLTCNPLFPILLLDGGLGTTLSSPPYDVTYDDSTSTWSSHLLLSSPSTLVTVHKSFLNAGVDIISTATYQASIEGFTHTSRIGHSRTLSTFTDVSEGSLNVPETPPKAPAHTNDNIITPTTETYTPDEAAAIMRSAIPLALSALPTNHRSTSCTSHHIPTQTLLLSLGPYGATLLPSTDYIGLSSYPQHMQSISALADWHYERLKIYASATEWESVQYVAFETIVSPEEVCAIREALGRIERFVKGKKVWVCTVVPEEVDQDENEGWKERVRRVVGEMVRLREGGREKLWGLGVNCTAVRKMERVVEVIEKAVTEFVAQERMAGNDREEKGYWLVIYPDGTKDERYDPETKDWVESERSGKASGREDREWEQDIVDRIRKVEKSGIWKGVVAGGCCKTGYEEIRKLRKRINEHREKHDDG